MVLDVEPPKCLATPLTVPTKLLMGAGPSNAAESVLRAGALPLLGHLHTEFIKVILIHHQLTSLVADSISTHDSYSKKLVVFTDSTATFFFFI